MPGEIPTALRLALSIAGGSITANAAQRRIEEQEAQADLVNELAKRDEFERQAATIAALRRSQAQTVLGPGGVHPAFGYEVPVGSDQGMIRTAALQHAAGIIGREMGEAEAAHRKQAGVAAGLWKNRKAVAGTAALGGALATGASLAGAGQGVRKVDTLLNRSAVRGRPVPQVKLGSVLVSFHHGDLEKEAGIGAAIMPALRSAAKAFSKKKQFLRGSGRGRVSAAFGALGEGARGGKRMFNVARTPEAGEVLKARRAAGNVTKYENRMLSKAPPKPAPAQVSAPARASAPAPTAQTAPAPAQLPTTPTPAKVTTTPAERTLGDRMKGWYQRNLERPVKWTAANPWKSALMGVGVPAVAYGGYKATTGAVDVLQRHNPQYNYNLGGYQLPTSVGQHGYTQAPTMRY